MDFAALDSRNIDALDPSSLRRGSLRHILNKTPDHHGKRAAVLARYRLCRRAPKLDADLLGCDNTASTLSSFSANLRRNSARTWCPALLASGAGWLADVNAAALGKCCAGPCSPGPPAGMPLAGIPLGGLRL